MEVIYLEQHISNKQYEGIIPILNTLSEKEQSRLIRTLLDFSPPQYQTRMIPWIITCLELPDQLKLIDTFRSSLSGLLLQIMFARLRKVLPVALCTTLIQGKEEV